MIILSLSPSLHCHFLLFLFFSSFCFFFPPLLSSPLLSLSQSPWTLLEHKATFVSLSLSLSSLFPFHCKTFNGNSDCESDTHHPPSPPSPADLAPRASLSHHAPLFFVSCINRQTTTETAEAATGKQMRHSKHRLLQHPLFVLFYSFYCRVRGTSTSTSSSS